MRSKPILFLCALIIGLWGSAALLSYGGSQQDTKGLEAALADLEPKIGEFPPNIASDDERREVMAQYRALEKKLNAAIKANPADAKLFFLSGKLHAMGHHLDIPGAWKRAETDLLEVIRREPNRKDALLELGSHYVNTSPDLAARAEKLFLEAQRVHGNEPLLAAQRGLIFAYYYQGKVHEALAASDTALKLSPNDKGLVRLREIIHSKLKEK